MENRLLHWNNITISFGLITQRSYFWSQKFLKFYCWNPWLRKNTFLARILLESFKILQDMAFPWIPWMNLARFSLNMHSLQDPCKHYTFTRKIFQGKRYMQGACKICARITFFLNQVLAWELERWEFFWATILDLQSFILGWLQVEIRQELIFLKQLPN